MLSTQRCLKKSQDEASLVQMRECKQSNSSMQNAQADTATTIATCTYWASC